MADPGSGTTETSDSSAKFNKEPVPAAMSPWAMIPVSHGVSAGLYWAALHGTTTIYQEGELEVRGVFFGFVGVAGC